MLSRQKLPRFKKFFWVVIFCLSLIPAAFAARSVEPEQSGQDVSQAQATMASLFGRGATIPSIPHMGGTLALPSFDSSGMEVSEGSLNEAQR